MSDLRSKQYPQIPELQHMLEKSAVPSGGECQCPKCGGGKNERLQVDVVGDRCPACYTCQHPWHDQPTPATLAPNTTPEGLATLGIGSQTDAMTWILSDAGQIALRDNNLWSEARNHLDELANVLTAFDGRKRRAGFEEPPTKNTGYGR